MAKFTRRNIRIALSDYNFIHKNKGTYDVYITDTFLYDFSFNIGVRSNIDVKNIKIEKYGEPYTDYKLVEESYNSYTIYDNRPLRSSAAAYTIGIELANGEYAERIFHIKVRHFNIDSDIKFISFASYGLHENNSVLRLLTSIETENYVDTVELYFRDNLSKDFVFVDNMTRSANIHTIDNEYIYTYDYLIFYVNLEQQKHVEFKAKCITAQGHIKEKTIKIMFLPASFSINAISGDKNNIYGGIVCRVNNLLNKYHDKIFSFVIKDKQMKLICDNYTFYSSDVKIEYPKIYNLNRTDKEPNVYKLTGKGYINVLQNGRLIFDTCRYNIILTCGETIYFNGNIIPDNIIDFTFNTHKTVNNIVKYCIKNNTFLLEANEDISHYKDPTLNAAESVTGYFQYDNILKFVTLNKQEYIVNNKISQDYLEKADRIIYHDEAIYYVNFEDDGIEYVKSDGFNFDKYVNKLHLTAQTREKLLHNNYLTFNTNQDLIMNFYNFDNDLILERVNIQNNVINIIEYNKYLQKAYFSLNEKLYNYLTSFTAIEFNKHTYLIDVQNQLNKINSFKCAGYENYIQNFIILQINSNLEYNVKVSEYINNELVTVTAKFLLSGTQIIKFTDNDYTVLMTNMYITSNIRDDNIIISSEEKYPNSNNIMIHSNNKFYLKFEESKTPKSFDEYGTYLKCYLYQSSYKLCDIPLIAADHQKRTKYLYADFIHITALQIDNDIVMLINNVDNIAYFTKINIATNEVIETFKINTTVIFNTLITTTTDRINTLEYIYSGLAALDTTPRTMKIYATSDLDQDLYVYGLMNAKDISGNKMNQEIDFSDEIRDSYSFSLYTNVDWPLNIKNRYNYLNTLRIHHKEIY